MTENGSFESQREKNLDEYKLKLLNQFHYVTLETELYSGIGLALKTACLFSGACRTA